MTGLLERMWTRAMDLNKENILRLLEPDASAVLLDLGCHDGRWTMQLAARARAVEVHGLDLVEDALAEAAKRGVRTSRGDLNARLPYADASFDCVHANQVIEHLHDTDLFISEVRRVLKPGGYAVVSTENLASWVNVGSLVFGWQPFSVTNISTTRLGIGNPMALHGDASLDVSTWLHVRVVALRALRELFEAHGFVVERAAGAGYFPLPAVLGRVDPRHSHFVTLRVRKPLDAAPPAGPRETFSPGAGQA